MHVSEVWKIVSQSIVSSRIGYSQLCFYSLDCSSVIHYELSDSFWTSFRVTDTTSEELFVSGICQR